MGGGGGVPAQRHGGGGHGCTLIWQIQALIRGRIARRSHKTLLLWPAYCLSVYNYGDYSFAPPPCSPGALNRPHFTNGKLSSRPGSGVYKYVKYAFNYFKRIWQLINKEGRDKHTLDTGHYEAAGKR